jgi:hypothetical protein
MSWEDTLRHRLDEDGFQPGQEVLPVSIKLRAESGCFHCRSCNPHASRVIDEAAWQHRHSRELRFEEHETGPELIIYLALGTAAVTLTKSVIDLVATFIKARADGKKHGDKSDAAIELIIRGFDRDGKIFEERVLRFQPGQAASRESVANALQQGLERQVLSNRTEETPKLLPTSGAQPTKPAKSNKRKRRRHR